MTLVSWDEGRTLSGCSRQRDGWLARHKNVLWIVIIRKNPRGCGVTVFPSHLLHRRLALRAEAADGAGVVRALTPAGRFGQSRDAAEEGGSFGLQLERQIVQDTQAVLHRLCGKGRAKEGQPENRQRTLACAHVAEADRFTCRV